MTSDWEGQDTAFRKPDVGVLADGQVRVASHKRPSPSLLTVVQFALVVEVGRSQTWLSMRAKKDVWFKWYDKLQAVLLTAHRCTRWQGTPNVSRLLLLIPHFSSVSHCTCVLRYAYELWKRSSRGSNCQLIKEPLVPVAAESI